MRRHQIKVLCDEDPQDFVQGADPSKIEIGRIVCHLVPDLWEGSCDQERDYGYSNDKW